MTPHEAVNLARHKMPALFPKHGMTDEELELLIEKTRYLPYDAVLVSLKNHRAESNFNRPSINKIVEGAKERARVDRIKEPRVDKPHGVYVAGKVKKSLGDEGMGMSDVDALIARAKGMIDRAKDKMLPVEQYLTVEIVNLRQWLPSVGCPSDHVEHLVDVLSEHAGGVAA